MSKGKLFVERRPQGDYAVRKPDSQRASAVAATQAKAIAQAQTPERDRSRRTRSIHDGREAGQVAQAITLGLRT